MESLNEFIKYVNLPYLCVFMCLAYALKEVLSELLSWVFFLCFNRHIKIVRIWSVFIIGTLTAIPFWFFFHHDKMVLFITWAIGTCFHDMIMKFVIKKLGIILNNKLNQ